MANNTFDTGTLTQLHTNFLKSQQKQQPAQPKKKGNFLVNNLPAIGGGLAAVAALPTDLFSGGVGSAVAAGAGSAAGEALKEKLLGQSLSPKQIAIQAGEGGATTAFQPLKILGKTGGAVKSFVKAGADTADKAVTQGAKTATSGLADTISNIGESLKGEARGAKPGVKVPGSSNPLSTTGSKEVNQYLDNLGTKNSAHKQILAVEQDIQDNGNKIGSLVQNNDRTVQPTEHMAIHAAGNKAAGNAIGLNKDSQVIGDVQKQINGANSLSDLQKVKTNIDGVLQNFYKQTDRNSSTTAEANVLKGYRDGINGVIQKAVPGYKEANSAYKTGLTARDLLYKNANPNGLRIAGIQTGVGGESVQAGKDLTGRILQRVAGKATTPVEQTAAELPQAAEQATSDIIPQSGASAGSALQSQAPQDLTSALQDASNAAGQIGTDTTTGLPSTSRAAQALQLLKNTATLPARAAAAPLAYPGQSALAVGKQVATRGVGDVGSLLAHATANKNTQPGTLSAALQSALTVPDTNADANSQQSPYTLDDLQYDLARDPTNSSKYIDYYNSLSKIYTPASTQLSGTQATNAANATSALQSLQTIAQTLQANPDAAKLADIPGGSLVGNATGTGDYQAAIANAKDVISRLRSGAAISASEEKTYTSLLPAAFDSPSTIQYKLQSLGTLLQQFVDPHGVSSNSSPSNLTDALVAAQ